MARGDMGTGKTLSSHLMSDHLAFYRGTPDRGLFDEGSSVERYFQVLELPLTATQEEIKSQYKQLVRVYHPDRFPDSDEKAAAEEKLKAINEAYRYLIDRLVTAYPVRYAAADLEVVVTPPMLDFGLLTPKVRTTQHFQVRFNQDMAENADFVCSEEGGWFKVIRVSHIYGLNHSALEFDIEVDTEGLAPQTYQGWIDVYLNNALTHVPLTLQVNEGQRWPRFAVLALTTALSIAVLSLGALAFTRSRSFTQPQVLVLAPELAQPQQWLHQVSFSLSEAQELMLYTLYVGGGGVGHPPARGVNGRGAVGSAAGQQVAYLGSDNEIYLLALDNGRSKPVTTGGEAKRSLSWSPDGSQLASLVGEGEHSRIGLYTVATGVTRELPGTGTAGVSAFAWGPDGGVLAFDLWQGVERRVYRINADGSGLQPLTHTDSWSPSWSADGRTLVVSSAQGLQRLDSQGRTVTTISNVVGEEASWSADGKWLAYLTREGARGEQTLWLLEVASGQAEAVASESVSYRWSPTGALLGYVTGRARGETPLLYLWTLTPGAQPTLVAEVNDPLFQWLK